MIIIIFWNVDNNNNIRWNLIQHFVKYVYLKTMAHRKLPTGQKENHQATFA